MGYHDTGLQFGSCRFTIEILYKPVDQAGHFGEQPSVVAEEETEGFRYRKDELPMRQIKQYFLSQILGEQKRPLLTTRRAEIESFAAKRSEIVVPTFGIRAPNSCDSLQIIAAGTELLTDALNPVQPKQAVPFRVPIFVFIAEFRKVSLEYLVKLVPSARDIMRFWRLAMRSSEDHNNIDSPCVVTASEQSLL